MSLAVYSPRHAKLPIKRLRCGACGKPPERLVEVGSISTMFDISADGWHRDAECAQGHRWRVRGILLIVTMLIQLTPLTGCSPLLDWSLARRLP